MNIRPILLDPADDFPRHQYADHLDDTGRSEQAAFIRDQLAGKSSMRRLTGCWREAAGIGKVYGESVLFSECQDMGWARVRVTYAANRPHDSPSLVFHFHRGFVSHVRMNWGMFRRGARLLFADHPITSVTLDDKDMIPVSRASSRFPDDRLPLYRGPAWVCWAGPAAQDDHSHFWPAEFLPWPAKAPDGTYTFPSMPYAYCVLSDLCVNWGRSQAGLPPLLPIDSNFIRSLEPRVLIPQGAF